MSSILFTKLYDIEFTQINGETYPRAPKQKTFTRESHWPQRNGRCMWCGIELIGRRKSYCTDDHRRLYYWFFSWDRVRREIFELAKGKCTNCHRETFLYESNREKRAEVDHIKAIALGGSYWDLNNLCLLCNDCHKLKTHGDLRKLAGKLPFIPLTEFFKNENETGTESSEIPH